MRLRLLMPLAIVFTLAGLLALAPARLVAWLLPPQSLVAEGYAGTLWRGSAARALVATPAGYFHLGGLQWRLSPWSLLLLRPALALEAAWGDQRLAGRLRLLGSDELQLRDASFGVDAALLRQLAPVSVSGRFNGQFRELTIDGGLPQSFEGRLTWERAAFDAPGSSFALGSYAVDFAPTEGGARGEVITLAGPLTATGSLSLDGRRYRVDLALASERALAQPLENALSLVATPTAGGYRLRLDGEL